MVALKVMTVFNSLLHDLQELSPSKLIEVIRYVHSLNPQSRERRRKVLEATSGCLSEEEGKDFEEAVRAEADRIDCDGSK